MACPNVGKQSKNILSLCDDEAKLEAWCQLNISCCSESLA